MSFVVTGWAPVTWAPVAKVYVPPSPMVLSILKAKLNPSTNVIATPNAIPVFERINQECEPTTRMNDELQEGVSTVGYQVPSNTHLTLVGPSRKLMWPDSQRWINPRK